MGPLWSRPCLLLEDIFHELRRQSNGTHSLARSLAHSLTHSLTHSLDSDIFLSYVPCEVLFLFQRLQHICLVGFMGVLEIQQQGVTHGGFCSICKHLLTGIPSWVKKWKVITLRNTSCNESTMILALKS